MSRNHRGRILGEPITRSLPAPAGGVQLETFVPWTLVKRGSKKEVVTPWMRRRNSWRRLDGSNGLGTQRRIRR